MTFLSCDHEIVVNLSSFSSIADQMISNHAKDLRTMLHNTFKINQFDSSNVSLPTCGAKVRLP